MKQYPRIYSLSTIGLIHHNENDYKFHPLRTDFVGESGCGKSMVADLLQLIMIGSEFYESATKGTDDRDLKDIVLPPPGKELGIGYAFINVEIAADQLFVMGAYIENTSNTAKSFIIQSNYGLESDKKIKPFSSPLLFQDFLEEGAIPDIDTLSEGLEKRKQLVCTHFQKSHKYHDILFHNGVMPLDLATSKKLLSDYASIIRSFSRGQGISTKDPDKLKEFLFGNADAERIFLKYNNAVKELEDATNEYGRNKDEIKKIVEKQKHVSDLKAKFDNRNSAKIRTHQYEVLHLTQEVGRIEKEILDNTKNLHEATINFETLKSKQIEGDILICQNSINDFKANKSDYDSAKRKLDEAVKAKPTLAALETKRQGENASALSALLKLEEATSWFNKLALPIVDISSRHSDYQTKKKLDEVFQHFKNQLIKEEIWGLFIKSKWIDGLEVGARAHKEMVEELQQDLLRIESLELFSDIDNPESLANWALSLERPITLDEESAIIYFQTLPRKQPEIVLRQMIRYLPDPSLLFDKLIVSEKNLSGYWINLGGTLEYIPTTDKPILSKKSKPEIRAYFQQNSQDLISEKKEILKKLSIHEKLELEIQKEPNSKAIIDNLKQLNSNVFRSNLNFEFSAEEIANRVGLLQNMRSITETHKDAKDLYDDAKSNRSINDIAIGLAKSRMDELEEIIGTNSLEQKEAELESLFINQKYQTKALSDTCSRLGYDSIKYKKICEDFISNSGYKISSQIEIAVAISKLEDVVKSYLSHQSSLESKMKSYTGELQLACEKYELLFPEVPIDLGVENIGITQLKQSRDEFADTQSAYKTLYEVIIQLYVVSEGDRFRSVDDFLGLTAYILPNVFRDVAISENNMIEQIQNYLDRINEKNRALNSRKIQRIKDILDEVLSARSEQLNTLRKIKNFLNDKDKQITGGYQVKLEFIDAARFSIDWINKFKEEIDRAGYTEGTLVTGLDDAVSFDEKLKEIYYQFGGAPHSNVKIKRLLDPLSYYDVKFTMQSESGRSNSGSTGQTYAAIALLCIARISIIGNQVKQLPGLRFIPIDEAEGLGSNYDMLYKIAKENDYQIISLSIGPVGKFVAKDQYLYFLSENPETDARVNYPPMGVFSEEDLTNHPILNGRK